jgi:ABC-type oligopeptide transport system substrate-binding subunit
MIRMGLFAEFLALSTAVVLAACGQNQTAEAPAAAQNVINRGILGEPDSLDHHKAASSAENHILGEVMLGLTTEDAQGRPMPGAAERWETSDDGLTWTFHLREHSWSDGTPVTAEDFLYGWRHYEAGDFDVGTFGWQMDFNDAYNFLFIFLSDNNLNYARYRDPEFDALLQQAQNEQDLQARGEILARAERMLLDAHAWIPTRYEIVEGLIQPHVRGWAPNIEDTNRTRWLTIDR